MRRWQWSVVLPGVVLLVMVVAVYLPAVKGEFLWDDDPNVTNNETLRSLDGLRKCGSYPARFSSTTR